MAASALELEIPTISARDIAALTRCDFLAMLVRGYIDDSADQNRERVVLAACYLASADDWDDLARRWQKRLNADGVKYFRSTEYYSLQGQFSRYRDAENYPKPKGSIAAKSLRDDLDKIISTSAVVGTAVCIPIDAYKDVRANVPNASALFSGDALESAFESLVELCAGEVKKRYRVDAKIAFVYDEDEGRAPKISRLYSQLKNRRLDLAGVMGGLSQLDDKEFQQLQAADMAAHIAKEKFEAWLYERTSEKLEDRLRTIRISSISYWSREYMLHELQRRIERMRWSRFAG